MSNLELWDRFADIDPAFTKPITGKSYRGTSPNPQYVIRCMTEMFGPVGHGFGWEVLQEGFMPLGDEILHWCRIRFWHGNRDSYFESYGQTKALMKTKNGLMSDEDAPKKSLTDAIVKAASHIGIAANIFLGRWDDQKYVQGVAEDFRETETKKTSAAAMKRGLEDIEKDLLDCHSIVAVNKCAWSWSHIMERDGWSEEYREFVKEKFATRRAALAEEPEPDRSRIGAGDAYRNAKDGKPAANILAGG